jgi:hypothetical protein
LVIHILQVVGFQFLLWDWQNNSFSFTFKAEIHQALLSHFSLLAEFLIVKVPAKD